VIKVENPRSPDPNRVLGGSLEPRSSSRSFKDYNRGKPAIALDLGSDAGRELLYPMVESADVFLTSVSRPFRAGHRREVSNVRRHAAHLEDAVGLLTRLLGGHDPRGGQGRARVGSRGLGTGADGGRDAPRSPVLVNRYLQPVDYPNGARHPDAPDPLRRRHIDGRAGTGPR